MVNIYFFKSVNFTVLFLKGNCLTFNNFNQCLYIVLQFQRNLTSFKLGLFEAPEAVVWRCSGEKVFLEILQNSQDNICA